MRSLQGFSHIANHSLDMDKMDTVKSASAMEYVRCTRLAGKAYRFGV
jgi:16S rRNA C1402 N4-methylase RsmH